MEAAVAETVARATREQAVQDARADLRELRRRAVEAGRERSRKITKTSRIDSHTGEIRYNPAGRLLRDWYLHVYLNTLRASLGEPAEPIDAQQVEDTSALLRRIRPGVEPLHALRAVGVIRSIASTDAAQAAAETVAQLRTVGGRRAALHAADDRFDGDQVRVHVTRHWYQRCYDDRIEAATRSQQPLAGVTDAEERQVALTLESRQIRRLIGRDGIPLITIHNTLLNEIDRRLAAGDTGVVPAAILHGNPAGGMRDLQARVVGAWANLATQQRSEWLRMAGAAATGNGLSWSRLLGADQTKIIRHYLETHRRELLDESFDRLAVRATPEIAARRMFNHRLPLLHPAGAPAKADDRADMRAAFYPDTESAQSRTPTRSASSQ